MSTKKKAATLQPQPWLALFDVDYAQSSCQAVKDAMLARASGQAVPMGDTLRQNLAMPADAYVQRHWQDGVLRSDVQAAERLRNAAQNLADLFADNWPFQENEAAARVASLYVTWLEFIGYVGGVLAWHVIPIRDARNWVSATQLRGYGKDFLPADVVTWMKEKGLSTLSQEKAAELAKRHKVSVSTVFRRLKMAKDGGQLS